MNKWLQKLESPARYFMWIFGMILAIVTVVSILGILNDISRPILLGSLILFFFAGLVVFIRDIQRSRQGAEIHKYTAQPRRNRWITIWLIIFVVIILVPILARQWLTDPLEYQSFLTAFAATGAWVTGIAIAVFAYQQYKLRQTEHGLLYEPQLILTSARVSTTGWEVPANLTGWLPAIPYQIKWTVVIQNNSQIPLLIDLMLVYVKLDEKDAEKRASLTPIYCRVLEPENLSTPFEVSLNKPQSITWVIEGSAGDEFDSVSRESNKRDFILIFGVYAKKAMGKQEQVIYKEVFSYPIEVPQDANWVSTTPVWGEPDKNQEEDKNT
jgi:hypothetical protein